MTRVLIAGRPKDDTVDVSVMYLRRVRAVGLVGAVAVAENEEDAAALADAFDALMLTGGADVYPARFGQTPNASNTYDGAQRDRSDELLFHAFRSRAKRILGICRGCQAINVYCGGTLHQHLPDAYEPVLWHARNIHG
ncbi:MAG: gamma-glutamyl-gamma-aminobutyrate hydrolase family protein, partial [Oscillospiraceae bacterium]|nr:gamma-glutamyl-gamma-aminobutyrate hydrolase family protein [Oscillospiraceae bacterium]